VNAFPFTTTLRVGSLVFDGCARVRVERMIEHTRVLKALSPRSR
jgi:hypothetical protein